MQSACAKFLYKHRLVLSKNHGSLLMIKRANIANVISRWSSGVATKPSVPVTNLLNLILKLTLQPAVVDDTTQLSTKKGRDFAE